MGGHRKTTGSTKRLGPRGTTVAQGVMGEGKRSVLSPKAGACPGQVGPQKVDVRGK